MIVKDPKKANWVIRFVYALLLLGYVIGWSSVYKAVDPLKNYNEMVIKYIATVTVNGKSISLKSFKDADELVNREVEKRVSEVRDRVKITFQTEDSIDLLEELDSGFDLVDTTLYENVDKDFDLEAQDVSKEEVKKVIESKDNYSILDRLLKSNKLVKVILLFLTFPAFSPLILAIVVKVLVTRIYVKGRNKIPNEVYMDKIPSMYTTNLILAIFALMIFCTQPIVGLAIAGYAHLLFIYQILMGLILAPAEVKK